MSIIEEDALTLKETHYRYGKAAFWPWQKRGWSWSVKTLSSFVDSCLYHTIGPGKGSVMYHVEHADEEFGRLGGVSDHLIYSLVLVTLPHTAHNLAGWMERNNLCFL